MDARNPYPPDIAGDEANHPGPEDRLSLEKWRAILRQRFRLLVGVAVVIFGLVALLTFAATPRYTATAQVLLDSRQQKVVDVQQVLSGLSADSSGVVDTEVQVLSSRSLAQRVVEALNLQNDPEFNGRLAPRPWYSLGPRPVAPTTQAGRELEAGAIAGGLLGRLKVTRAGATTYVINVAFSSKSPQKAALIANSFADQYLNDQLEAKFDATRRANAWLNSRLAGLRAQAEAADAAVQSYKAQNGLLSSEGNTLTEQSISQINEQIAIARASEAEADARVSTARSQLAHGSNGEDVGEALSSPVVQQLRAQRSEVSRQLADLEGRYGPRHPDLLKARRQLADIDTQITAEVGRLMSSLVAQAQLAHQRTASLEASLSQSRRTLAANNNASVGLSELERNADSIKTLYQSYLDRFKQTSAQEGIEQSDARVLSYAPTPGRPSFPNIPLNLILGLVLGLGGGITAVVIGEALDQGLSTGDEVEARFGLSSLPPIPLLASLVEGKLGHNLRSPADYIVEKPLSRFAEAFRSLRTAITYADLERRVQVIAVASAVPGEGKTTTCVGLARTAALAGARVTVVDCDLRRRSLHKMFGGDPKQGLLEVLAGTANLDDVLMVDSATGATGIPVAASEFSPKDVFGSPAMDNLIAVLRTRFDLILLDTPPILAVAEAVVIAAKADAVVLLTRWRKTPRRYVASSIKVLSSVGAYVFGVSLTQLDAREQAKAGYGDGAYYYKKYRDYYSE